MKFYEKAQDPISFFTHFIGAVLAIIEIYLLSFNKLIHMLLH